MSKRPKLRKHKLTDHERIQDLENKCQYLYELNMQLGHNFIELAKEVDAVFGMNKQVSERINEFLNKFMRVTPEMLDPTLD